MPTNPYRQTVRSILSASGKTTPKTKRLHYERLMLNAAGLRTENPFDYHVQAAVPQAWDTLERDVDVEEKKLPISLRLDESVVKFYRAMGKGYQVRMNRVLATFAQMRIAEIRRLEEMTREELAKIDELRED